MVDPTAIFNLYTQYVFGSAAITTLFMVIFVVLLSIRYGWTLPTYVAVSVPFVYFLSTRLDVGIVPIYLIGVGILLGIAMLMLIRR